MYYLKVISVEGDSMENAPAICVNINECNARNLGVCSGGDGNQICIDNDGGFTCVCGNGFSGDAATNGPAQCTDVNECNFDPCIR